MTTQAVAKTKVFISYSSRDQSVAETIHKSLEDNGFDVWRDQTRLEADWSREIAFALADSDLLCLIWSENSATSKWVKHEWLTARALEKRIIPCLLPKAPDLPESLHNVHGISFASFAEGCSVLNKRISEAKCFFEQYNYTILPRNSYIPFNPNPHFTGRHVDLLELYLKMIGNLNKIGITQVGTIGMGGIGKTQLVVEFAHRFSYGFHAVYWIQAAQPETWPRDFTSLVTSRLRDEIKDFDKLEGDRAYLLALQEYFKDHPSTLVIMDNVTEPKLLNNDSYLFGLTPLTLGCDLLFTTRQHFQLPGVASQAVNMLSTEAAYDLLAAYRAPETPEDEDHARAICYAVGFLPLAITLVGAYLDHYRSDISFADYHEELFLKRLDAIDIGEMSEEDLATRHVAAVKATLEDQWRMLKDDDARQLFRIAGHFPEAAIIPKARLGLFAGIGPGRSKIDQPLAKAFNHLHDLCLVERLEGDTSSARLHPLVREFANQLVPEAERAVFRATATERLREALFEYTRLEKEVRTRGVEEVIADLETGLDWWGIDGPPPEELKLLQGALRLSAHVLLQAPEQLTAQLYGRLRVGQSTELDALIRQTESILAVQALHPLTQNLRPAGSPLKRILSGHEAGVKGALELVGGNLLSWSVDGTLRLWTSDGVPLGVFEGHEKGVESTLALADGRLLSWSWDGTLRLWAVDGAALGVLEGHKDMVKSALELADGRLLSWSWDGTLRLWAADGAALGVLEGHESGVKGALELADGRLLSWTPKEKTLRLWAADGAALGLLEGHESGVKGALELADGRLLSCSEDKTLRLWAADGTALGVLEGHKDWVYGALELADGRLLSWSVDKTLRLWAADGFPLGVLEGHKRGVNGTLALADSRLLSWSGDKTLRLWAADGVPLAVLEGHESDAMGALALADGRLLSWSEDQTLRLWGADGAALGVFEGHEGGVWGALALADGRLLSWSEDQTLRLWAADGAALRVLEGHKNWVDGALVLADGRLLSWSMDKTLWLWGASDGAALGVLEGHKDWVYGALELANGRLLSWSGDQTLRLWGADGVPLAVLEGHEALVKGALELADGRLLSWSVDQTLRLWAADGVPLGVLEGHEGGVNGALALADSRLLSWSVDQTLRLWAADGTALGVLEGHESYVEGALCLADGRLLSWSVDQTLRLWRQDGTALGVLEGHEDWVYGALALADGRLLSWSRDNMLRLWAADGTALGALEGHEGGVYRALELADGRLLSWSGDKTLRLWASSGEHIGVLRFDAAITTVVKAAGGLRFLVGDGLGGIHWVEVT